MVQRLILGLIMAAALVGPARAESIESRERTARTSCLTGDYAKGAAILSELFVDTRNPTHIYNQGRCFEQNRRFEDAVGRFEEYLRVGRDLSPEEIAEAKKHIADCQQRLSGQANAAPRPSPVPVTVELPSPGTGAVGPAAAEVSGATATPPAESPHKPGRGLRGAGIVVGAAGVAGVVAGVLLSLKASSLASDMEKLDGYTSDKESSRKDYRNLGFVAYGVGGACIATGGVLLFLGLRAGATEAPSFAFSPLLTPGGAGAAIAGAF